MGYLTFWSPQQLLRLELPPPSGFAAPPPEPEVLLPEVELLINWPIASSSTKADWV
jgi:hypothetical protein